MIKDIAFHRALLVLLFSMMCFYGYGNLQQQWSIKGEYSNYPMEDLIDWIHESTPESNYYLSIELCLIHSGLTKSAANIAMTG